MKNKTTQYLSKMAQNINPYQWEEGIGDDMLRFDGNTMPYPPRSLHVFLKEMGKKCLINEYADPSYKKLKKLIASYEGVNKEMITVTNSGDEAIDVLAKTFLNAGDYFIVTPPTYEVFTVQCEVNRGKPLAVPLIGEKFEVDEKEVIRQSKNPKVKLIYLCNPNNPTTTVIPQKVIEKIVENSSCVVVIDEVYREFYGKTSLPLLKKYDNLVILRSFSKFAAMAGARIGYLLTNKFFSRKFDGIRFPMGVSYLSYKLAETVLEKDQDWMKSQIEMIKKERSRLTENLQNLGFYVFPSQANFLLVKVGKRASELSQKLKQKKILVRDRSKKKYLEGCVRITVRSPNENRQLIKAIKEVL